MSEDEGKFSVVTGVGEPVPVEGAFAADGDVVTERRDIVKEGCAVSGLVVAMLVLIADMVDDAGVHLVGVQIDSAVEWVLSLIKTHLGSPWVGLVLSQLSDASSDDVCRFAANTVLTTFYRTTVMERLTHPRRP